jgi:hypothetical protein
MKLSHILKIITEQKAVELPDIRLAYLLLFIHL